MPTGTVTTASSTKYDDKVPNELMVQYSIVYDGLDTNTHVFFIKPDSGE